MKLSKYEVRDFQKLWLETTGEQLSEKLAQEYAGGLIGLAKVVFGSPDDHET